MNIDESYEYILQPDELIKHFESFDVFEEWCTEGSVLDLQEALKVFEEYELYEYCAIMKAVIDFKLEN